MSAPKHPHLEDRRAWIRARFLLVDRLRDVLRDRGYLQVDTPALLPAPATDPFVTPLALAAEVPGRSEPRTLYLRTSPEFELKCLLALGFPAVFEIGRVFRSGDLGALHNPEFLMAEWYRTGWTHCQLMDELVDVLRDVLAPGPHAPAGFSLPADVPRLSIDELYSRCTGIAVSELQDGEALWDEARRRGLVEDGSPRAFHEVFSWLWVEHVDADLAEVDAALLVDWPAALAELASVDSENPALACRFELVVRGIELANGYSELTSPDEVRERFAADLRERRERGLASLPMPEDFLAGIGDGLPASAGVSLGVDRLAMLACGRRSIHDLLRWSWHRVPSPVAGEGQGWGIGAGSGPLARCRRGSG
jgi:elongation factor P--(R)-beta-lysine ligase